LLDALVLGALVLDALVLDLLVLDALVLDLLVLDALVLDLLVLDVLCDDDELMLRKSDGKVEKAEGLRAVEWPASPLHPRVVD
jgi:hypothetical protein